MRKTSDPGNTVRRTAHTQTGYVPIEATKSSDIHFHKQNLAALYPRGDARQPYGRLRVRSPAKKGCVSVRKLRPPSKRAAPHQAPQRALLASNSPVASLGSYLPPGSLPLSQSFSY